jgi:transcriptional regulator with XRE-family HTH domain
VSKNKLKETRLNKGLSQETLADLIGMTQCNYSRRENGRKVISDTEWTKIAKALDVNKETIYETNILVTNHNNTLKIPYRSFFEPESISIDNSKSVTTEINSVHHYNITKEMVDNQHEYINILKIEINSLKKENIQLKEKLLVEKKKNTTFNQV